MSRSVHIKKSVEVLGNNGVVIFPTDTAFGIGCRADSLEAVQKVFSIRRRPSTQAVPVLCSSIQMVKEYVLDFTDEIKNLADNYWPGALTVILPAQLQKLPPIVRGGGLTVGVRIPHHPLTVEMIQNLGTPVIGPSANFHGEPTPYEMADIDPMLFNLVDYVMPGVCSVKKESTVIDCSVRPWKVVRQGAIKLDI